MPRVCPAVAGATVRRVVASGPPARRAGALRTAGGAGALVGHAAVAVCLTVAAGFLGWSLVQTYHVRVGLIAHRAQDEKTVQSETALRAIRGATG